MCLLSSAWNSLGSRNCVVGLWIHCRLTVDPLRTHCRPTADPLQIHCRPTADPLQTHCGSVFPGICACQGAMAITWNLSCPEGAPRKLGSPQPEPGPGLASTPTMCQAPCSCLTHSLTPIASTREGFILSILQVRKSRLREVEGLGYGPVCNSTQAALLLLLPVSLSHSSLLLPLTHREASRAG